MTQEVVNLWICITALTFKILWRNAGAPKLDLCSCRWRVRCVFFCLAIIIFLRVLLSWFFSLIGWISRVQRPPLINRGTIGLSRLIWLVVILELLSRLIWLVVILKLLSCLIWLVVILKLLSRLIWLVVILKLFPCCIWLDVILNLVLLRFLGSTLVL